MRSSATATIHKGLTTVPKNPDHRIKAILFDLDGVLVDGPAWHKEAFDLMLRMWGYDPLSDEEHIKTFNGLSSKKKIAILKTMGRVHKAESIQDMNDSKQLLTKQIIEEKCRPITRVIDTVNYANSIFDGNTGVVTNCSRETAELMLSKSNLLDKFRVIITNEDVCGKIKPHPWPYLKAQELLGLVNKKKVALAIDDTSKGIQSALDAGCRTWWLKNFEDLSVRNLMKTLSAYRIVI